MFDTLELAIARSGASQRVGMIVPTWSYCAEFDLELVDNGPQTIFLTNDGVTKSTLWNKMCLFLVVGS